MYRFALCLIVVSVSGCVLAPEEASDERKKLEASEEPYRQAFADRSLPELSTAPSWQDVLRRALLANGELEAAYHQWVMAVWRIQQAGAWPNTPVSVDFEYMFSGERLKGWDRTTFTIGFDPMLTLAFPSKAYQSASVAWRDAQAAGERFCAAKFALQRKILHAWFDYSLLAEKARIQARNIELLRLLNQTTAGRVRAGGPQQDMLRTEVQLELAENDSLSFQSQLAQQRATLNAMLARPSDSLLDPPASFPQPRPLHADDAALLALGVANNPELTALARDVAGREDAVERARLEYIPDFNPFVGGTGGLSQVVGLGVTLPTVIPQIQGMIAEARANLKRADAQLRQARFDRSGEFVATLYMLRNSERQACLFTERVLPRVLQVMEATKRAYSTGGASYLDLIDSQRTLLEVRLMIVEAAAQREKSLVDLEALAGVDMETIENRLATQPPASKEPRDD
jgi:outer membrane protein TolC